MRGRARLGSSYFAPVRGTILALFPLACFAQENRRSRKAIHRESIRAYVQKYLNWPDFPARRLLIECAPHLGVDESPERAAERQARMPGPELHLALERTRPRQEGVKPPCGLRRHRHAEQLPQHANECNA